MLTSAWIIPLGIAVGVLVSLAPSRIARLRMSQRIARGLKVPQRVVDVDPAQLASYDMRQGPYASGDVLDERTWEDLDLDAVFGRVDRCASQPGRQLLYHMLRRPSLDGVTVLAFDASVETMRRDPAALARVRHALIPLATRQAARLETSLFGALPARPALWWVFPLLTVLSVSLLALIVVWPLALIGWIGVCIATMIAQMLYRPRVREFVPAMQALPDFIDVSRALGAMALPGLADECAVLREGAARLRGLESTTGWLRFDNSVANELAGSLYEYGNLLFALDLTAFVLTTTRLQAVRETAQAMYRALGRIDAMHSIATWRDTLPAWTAPVFTSPGKALHCESLVHPLLEAGVPNSLHVHDTSVLVTGSNMSGKSTFLRALGVNAVLAQAVGTVCASTWNAPVLHVRTSIGQGDSLLDGKSLYMAEIDAVKRMLDEKAGGAQHLFLLDELFRGTNTPERVAAGYATLAWLDRGDDVVVVATHDLELSRLLGARFEAYHFREQVTDESLAFDFRIRPGLSSTRNAIALLRLSGFPAGLVAEANATLTAREAEVPAERSPRDPVGATPRSAP